MQNCSDLGYAVGDLFEVINVSKGLEKDLTKGMILKLVRDDYSELAKFEYASGDTTDSMYCGVKLWVSLNDVKKINTIKIQPDDKVSQQPETYTKQDIVDAFKHLNWSDSSEGLLLKALKEVTDSEYKDYVRLKQKFETKE